MRTSIPIFITFIVAIAIAGCVRNTVESHPQTDKSVPDIGPWISFAYPIGKTETSTQAKDSKDEWFNALDFGSNNHLGEDWNKNSGGNTDCGEPVFAAADGVITYAGDAGPGWGNVLIVEHKLADGERVQTLYGHMQEMLKTSGEVKKREQIGKIGNANGRYLCHLHFELRTSDCPMWNEAGGGYSANRKGWLDPSDFIDEQRR